ncbi:g11713 [Coccomyxa viridis]|uniref:G11713 protein n=1 Tax=Coccomyxa viridis TaxID=1274662 RepID=A0ABP1GB83_9CHLO
MARVGLGALAGAGGATAYMNGFDFSNMARSLLLGSPHQSLPWQAQMNNKGEMDALYKLVEQLSKDMHRQQGVTISMAHNKGNGTVLLYTVGVGGVAYVYLRIFKGWRLSDLMYVTRSSLSRSMSSVTAGVDGLTQRLSNMRQFVQQQINTLTAKQDDTLAAQAALEKQLAAVGDDVEDINTRVGEVHASVREMEGNLENMALSQQNANEGIFLLCKVVGDLMKSAGMRLGSVAELETYIRRPRNIGNASSIPGLEGVLQSSRDSEADSAGFNAVRRLGNGPTATRTRSCAPSTEWEHLSRASTS